MIIVFGGSFNPVTKAHFNIYKYIKEHFSYDKFIILPTSTNYNKSGLIDNIDRINMLKIAFLNTDVTIDEKECMNSSYKGTYDYLKSLNDNDVYFVLGADNLIEIKSWINSESLIKEYKFIVFKRNDFDVVKFISEELKLYKDNFIVVNDFDIDISSSQFRLTYNESLVDSKVYEYIKSKNLYKGK